MCVCGLCLIMQKEKMHDSVERARMRRLEEEQRVEAERRARAAAKLAVCVGRL